MSALQSWRTWLLATMALVPGVLAARSVAGQVSSTSQFDPFNPAASLYVTDQAAPTPTTLPAPPPDSTDPPLRPFIRDPYLPPVRSPYRP